MRFVRLSGKAICEGGINEKNFLSVRLDTDDPCFYLDAICGIQDR